MEVLHPEIPGTEDDIQKDQIQKVLNKLQDQMSYVLIIFLLYTYSSMLYISYRADMKSKGHGKNSYILYL